MVGGGPNPSPLPPPAGDGCAGPPPPNGLAAGELPVLGSKLLLFFVALRLEGEGSPSPNPTCSLPADGLLPSPNELTSAGVGRKNGFRNGASLPWLIESCPLLSRRSLPLLFGGTPNGEGVSPPPFRFGGGKKPPAAYSSLTKGFGPAPWTVEEDRCLGRRCAVAKRDSNKYVFVILLLWWLEDNNTGKALTALTSMVEMIRNKDDHDEKTNEALAEK